MVSYATPDTGTIDPYARNLTFVKDFCKKPLVLIAAVLYSVSILLSAAVLVQNVSSFANMAQSERIIPIASMNEFYIVLSVILGAAYIIPLLSALGLWMIYLKSRSQDPESSPNGGLTLLYVLTIIEMAVLAVATAFVVYLMYSPDFYIYWRTFAYYLSNMSDISVSTQTIQSIFIIVIVLAVAIAYLYLAAKLRFVNSIRRSSRNVMMQNKGTILFAVLHIFSGLSMLSSLSSLSSASSTTAMSGGGYAFEVSVTIWTVLNVVVTLALTIVLIILAFSYHAYANKMNSFIYSSAPIQQPTYANPFGQPYAPQNLYPPQNNYPQSYQQPPINPQQTQFQNPYEHNGHYEQRQSQPMPPAAPMQNNQPVAPAAPENPQDVPVCSVCGAPVDPAQDHCPHCGSMY